MIPIYVTTMVRNAASRNKIPHSYIVSVNNSEELAIEAGEKEREYRGGTKYGFQVTRHVLNALDDTGIEVYNDVTR